MVLHQPLRAPLLKWPFILDLNYPKFECPLCRSAPLQKFWGSMWLIPPGAEQWSGPVLWLSSGLTTDMHSLPGQQHPFLHLPPQNTTQRVSTRTHTHRHKMHTDTPGSQVCTFISIFFWWPVLPAWMFASYLHVDNTYWHPPVPHSIYLLTKPAPLPGHVRFLHFPHLVKILPRLSSIFSLRYTASPSVPMPFYKSGFTSHLMDEPLSPQRDTQI